MVHIWLVSVTCENGNEYFGSMEGENIFDHLSKY
jgi:hypothetical protein